MRKTFRDGNVMISVETAPAVIEFADILDATKVVSDEYETMTPWENCDGFEHEAIPSRCLPDEADARAMHGYIYWDRERHVLTLPKGEDYGIYQYMRAQGASRQVAAEAVAAKRRRTLDQLKGWYANGWQWHGVKCNFEVLGEEFEASVWGIDDEDYAEREVKQEIALEVAAQLEAAGYTVIGRPEPEKRLGAKRQSMTPEAWRAEYARNLAAQNWRV